MRSLTEYIKEEYGVKKPRPVKSNFTEKEKNDLAKKYTPLVYKIANKYKGYDAEELFSVGLLGLSHAIEYYNKEKIKDNSMTELAYFAKNVDFFIKDYIKDYSRLIRVPRSRQLGKDIYNKEYNINLDKLIYKDNYSEDDEDDIKSNPDFDYTKKIKYIDSKYTDSNIKFVNDTWKKIFNDIEKNLGKKYADIIKSFYGIDCEPIKGKKLANKYGYNSPSSITNDIIKVKRYMEKNFRDELKELYDLYTESAVNDIIDNIIKEDFI